MRKETWCDAEWKCKMWETNLFLYVNRCVCSNVWKLHWKEKVWELWSLSMPCTASSTPKPVSVCMYGGIEAFISWEPSSPPWAGMLRVVNNALPMCACVFTCVSPQWTRQTVHTLILDDTRGELHQTLHAAAGHNISAKAARCVRACMCLWMWGCTYLCVTAHSNHHLDRPTGPCLESLLQFYIHTHTRTSLFPLMSSWADK